MERFFIFFGVLTRGWDQVKISAGQNLRLKISDGHTQGVVKGLLYLCRSHAAVRQLLYVQLLQRIPLLLPLSDPLFAFVSAVSIPRYLPLPPQNNKFHTHFGFIRLNKISWKWKAKAARTYGFYKQHKYKRKQKIDGNSTPSNNINSEWTKHIAGAFNCYRQLVTIFILNKLTTTFYIINQISSCMYSTHIPMYSTTVPHAIKAKWT